MLAWRGRPGFEGVHYRANLPPTKLKLNRRGWRDVERTTARTPGRRRIVLLGDSFALGLGVAFGQSLRPLLEKELGRTDVINLAMNGSSTDQELLVLESEGLAYRPGAHGAPTPGLWAGLSRTLRNRSELFRRLWVRRRMAKVRARLGQPVSPDGQVPSLRERRVRIGRVA